MRRFTIALALCSLTLAPGMAQQPQPQNQAPGRVRPQRPARDTQPVPLGTAVIAGRVVAADTGRPVKRAHVIASAGGRSSRTATTDDQGRFRIIELAAGNYTIVASRTGFVDAVYGQRRPLQPGTPVQLADGEEIAHIDLRLVRGSVITGRVLEEDGEPLARAIVTVQRYQYVRGERQLTPAGRDQSDDRGQYRVFGLPPGDYYVSADAGPLAQALGRGLQQLGAALAGGPGGRGGRGGLFASLSDDPEPLGYAPTYYPGVVSAADAAKVTVGPGQELTGIDFQVQLVHTATVSGIVVGAEDTVPVLLVPLDGGGMIRGQILRGGTQPDGTFSITNVPPGRYTAVARSGGGGPFARGASDLRVGMQPVTVAGEDVAGVTLALQSGVALSGNITVESSGTPAPTDYSVFRVQVPDVEPLPFAGGGRGGPLGADARAEKNGAFSVRNLLPGRHYIRVAGNGVWTLKSITIAGRDVTDQPIELRSGQDMDNVTIVMTDRATEISGTVREAGGAPAGAMAVIAFSTDPQQWRPQSRHIQSARTNESGVYRLRGLPPGDYRIVAVDDVEQGEWFDPAFLQRVEPAAERITLSEGEKKTQDLKPIG